MASGSVDQVSLILPQTVKSPLILIGEINIIVALVAFLSFLLGKQTNETSFVVNAAKNGLNANKSNEYYVNEGTLRPRILYLSFSVLFMR